MDDRHAQLRARLSSELDRFRHTQMTPQMLDRLAAVYAAAVCSIFSQDLPGPLPPVQAVCSARGTVSFLIDDQSASPAMLAALRRLGLVAGR